MINSKTIRNLVTAALCLTGGTLSSGSQAACTSDCLFKLYTPGVHGTAAPYRSCLDAFNQGQTSNGYQTITVNGVARQAYCNMTMSPGGWTLVYSNNTGQAGNALITVNAVNVPFSNSSIGKFSDSDINAIVTDRFQMNVTGCNTVYFAKDASNPFSMTNRGTPAWGVNSTGALTGTQSTLSPNYYLGLSNYGVSAGSSQEVITALSGYPGAWCTAAAGWGAPVQVWAR